MKTMDGFRLSDVFMKSVGTFCKALCIGIPVARDFALLWLAKIVMIEDFISIMFISLLIFIPV